MINDHRAEGDLGDVLLAQAPIPPPSPSPRPPVALPVQADALPAELRERRQWVAWRYRYQGDTWRKPPVSPATGAPASTTDPASWGTFEEARARRQTDGLAGVGVVITADDPFVAIDLDGAIDPLTREVAPWAQAVVDRFGSYAERSAGGLGLHVLVRARRFPTSGNRRGATGPKTEVYWEKRYLAMTGAVLPGHAAIMDRTEELLAWHAEVFPAAASPGDRAGKEHRRERPSPDDEERRAGLAANDEEVLARCGASAKFRALYDDGDLSAHGGDHSAADLALLSLIVLAGATDPVQLDRLFRSSALVRPKWTGRADYRERTIDAALGAEVRSGDGDPLDVLRRRLAAAERALETERRLRRQHSGLLAQIARLLRNPTLKNERNVAVALAHRFAHFESRHEVPPYPITVAEIAEAAGINRNTAGRHVAKLEAAGLVTRETRLVPGFVDPTTGEIVPPKTPTFLAPIGGSVGFLTAVAELDGKSAWGGKRARTQDGSIPSTEQGSCAHDPGDDGTTGGCVGGLQDVAPHPTPHTVDVVIVPQVVATAVGGPTPNPAARADGPSSALSRAPQPDAAADDPSRHGRAA